MSFAVFAKTVRNIVTAAEINLNRSAGREFIALPIDTMNIETSSTCNLKCRICAYDKKDTPRVSMSDEAFADIVAQSIRLGYRRFNLTPCTGDAFMDRHIFNKLQMLDDNPQVQDYGFFTNFSIPDTDDIERLFQLKKLYFVIISIYGHDLESFRAITQSTEKVYHRLVSNLNALHQRLGDNRFGVEIGLRSTRDQPRKPNSDLLQALQRFKQAGIKIRTARVYNNWGGFVTEDDVKGLAIDVTGTEDTYKNGPCAMLFAGVQVRATGIVNACACRDVNTVLKIGDVNERPLREIISTQNADYMNLIDEQMRGEFRPVCRSCDFYKSIFHLSARQFRRRNKGQSLAEFKAGLDARQAGADQRAGDDQCLSKETIETR
jgi:MoaA/NifB/PqqE/SkfB family radical SAM enzyme